MSAAGVIVRKELPSGTVVWKVRMDLGRCPDTSKRRQRQHTCATQREARALLTRWQSERNAGTFVDRTPATLADTLRYWLDTHARSTCKPNVYRQYRATIEKHVVPGLGHIQVQAVTPARLQSWYADQLARGIGTRTLNLCHLRIRQACDQAVKLGTLARNPARIASPPVDRPAKREIWTAAQLRTFLNQAEGDTYSPLWLVLAYTGLRRGEVLGLTWDALDLANGSLRVTQAVSLEYGRAVIGTPKTAAAYRSVPLSSIVMDALSAHMATQESIFGERQALVFPSASGGPINPNNLHRVYKRIIRAARVPDISLHDIRHTYVSLLLASGQPVNLVSQVIGHANPATTWAVYAHTLPGQDRALADTISALIKGPLVNAPVNDAAQRQVSPAFRPGIPESG